MPPCLLGFIQKAKQGKFSCDNTNAEILLSAWHSTVCVVERIFIVQFVPLTNVSSPQRALSIMIIKIHFTSDIFVKMKRFDFQPKILSCDLTVIAEIKARFYSNFYFTILSSNTHRKKIKITVSTKICSNLLNSSFFCIKNRVDKL